MSAFVAMYNPALPGSPHVLAPVRAQALYAAHGWLVVDGSTPAPTDIYLTPGVGDLRYAKLGEVLPKWKPSTAYTAGDFVLNPSGQVVSANATFTSGASYSAGNWTVVSGGGGGAVSSVAGRTGVVTLASTDLTDSTATGQALVSAATAAAGRTTLGLGSAATQPSSAFDTAGAAALRAPLLVPTATKTATYTAAVGDLAMMNVPAGGATLNLPAAPADKAQVGYRAIGATNAVPLTINRGGSDTIGTTGATSASIVMADETVVLQYDAANTRWLGIANVWTQASVDNRYGGSYGLAVGRANCTVPVGTHAGVYGNGVSNGTDTSTAFRVFVPLSDPTATTVLPAFNNQPNYSVISAYAGDQAPPNPITVSAAVELSDGTVVPFTFAGSRTVTIPSGGVVLPDAPVNIGAQVTDSNAVVSGLSGVVFRTYVTVAASRADSVTTTSGSATVTDTSILATDKGRRVTGTGIPATSYVGTVTPGASFLLSTKADAQVNVTATASGTVTATLQSVIPLNYGTYANANRSAGVNSTTDIYTGDGAAASQAGFGGSNALSYGPALVLAPPTGTRKPIVASLTDSIFYGTTETQVGPVARACAQYGFGHVKLSKVGEYALSYTTPVGRKFRANLINGCSHAVIELGTNDGLSTLGTATTLQSSLTTMLTWLNGLGIKSIICTVPPKGNSTTDGYATLANQTPYNIAAALAQVNGWIRGLVGTLGVIGVIDLSTILSSATDSGLWAQGPNGRHLTDLAATSGSNVVTSATANFTSADIGTAVYVTGAYTSYIDVIGSLNSSTSVNITNTTPTGAVVNSGATVTGAVGAVGAWYATQDGTHPSSAMMLGGVLTAVKAAMAGLAV